MDEQTKQSLEAKTFQVFAKLLDSQFSILKPEWTGLVDFLDERHHLIYSKPFAFRLYHSTNHAVLSIIDQVQKAIEDHYD